MQVFYYIFSDVILYINSVASPCSGSKVCITSKFCIKHYLIHTNIEAHYVEVYYKQYNEN